MNRKPHMLLLLLALLAAALATAGNASAGPGYLSVLFGRSQYAESYGTKNPVPLPGTVPLDQAVAWLSTQGVPAVGTVATDRMDETQLVDVGNALYAPWSLLMQLHAQYGFETISQSDNYNGWASFTQYSEFQDAACGSLPIFAAHGFTRAWGMFGYPGNYWTPTAEQAATSCFAFSRLYNSLKNVTMKQALQFPYPTRVDSVTGGSCNDPTLACYTDPVKSGGTYDMPSQVISQEQPGADQYSAVQFYRLVSGSNLDGVGADWDCTSSDPAQHWTNEGELYCYNDFQAVIQGRSFAAVVTDPATVATAWGRLP